MSNSIKELLSLISSIKQLNESNNIYITSIKDISEEIFNITTERPLPYRISLISKKTTNILRKENSFINNSKELFKVFDKLEIMILNILKTINTNELKDNYEELNLYYQRKNNELEKLRNINENLNKEINSLKNKLNATYHFGKFSNEELNLHV